MPQEQRDAVREDGWYSTEACCMQHQRRLLGAQTHHCNLASAWITAMNISVRDLERSS